MDASAVNLVFCLTLVLAPAVVHGRVCRPSCIPPGAEGCRIYHKTARCRPTSMKMPEVLCGCIWKDFIWRADRVSRLIFTDKGRKCYEWAALACEEVPADIKVLVQDELDDYRKQSPMESADNLIYDMMKRIHQLEKGEYIIPDTGSKVAKGNQNEQPFRNVVATGEVYGKLEDDYGRPRLRAVERFADVNRKGNIWGKIYKDPQTQWYEIRPGEDPHSADRATDQGWFIWDNDQFKLLVFGFILLFNIICIIIAIICKCDQKTESKETKKAGDLDPSRYTPPGVSTHKKWSHVNKFIEKLRLHHLMKAKKNSMKTQEELTDFEASKYFQMTKQPVQIYTATPKSKKKNSYVPMVHDDSHYYENLAGTSQLNLTYDQPMVRDRSDTMPHWDTHTMSYTQDSFTDGDLSASPQYSPRSHTVEVAAGQDPEPKQVSFSIPSGINQMERISKKRSRMAKKGVLVFPIGPRIIK